MPTEVQICNVALYRIGSKTKIADRTERGAEAIACDLFFDDDRDFVLRAFPWPFTRRYRVLALVDGSSSAPATYDWVYAYRYPSDALAIRRITTPLGRAEANPPPFATGSDETGRLVYTDYPEAEVEYSVAETDPARFDAEFASALGWRLASNIAPSLSRIPRMAERAYAMFLSEIAQAKAHALNEGQQAPQVDSEFIRERA